MTTGHDSIANPVPRVAPTHVRDRLDASGGAGTGVQIGLDQLGTPLAECSWVVVDLETTGLGADCGITEIGAARMVRGEVVDTFHTMVDPGGGIPAFITALTGITDSMVEGAPAPAEAVAAFLDWAALTADGPGRTALVAHNAPFDTGFLRRAVRDSEVAWPRGVPVVDTLALSRVACPRPIVANHKLGTLATYFNAPPQDAHRALGDAQTTAHVLSGLLAALEPLGVSTLQDLRSVADTVAPRRRQRVDLVADAPVAPGVYRFLDDHGIPLYIGSATSLKSRLRSYFGAAEKRKKVHRLVEMTAKVEWTATSSVLDARIRELRELHVARPLFNAASTQQDNTRWIVRDGDRLDVVPVIPQEMACRALGPYSTAAHCERAMDAITRVVGRRAQSPLGQADRLAPGAEADADLVLSGHDARLVETLQDEMSRLCDVQDYEGAAHVREVLGAYLHGVGRAADVWRVAGAERLIWGRPRPGGGWELHLASWGSHLATLITPPGTSPLPWIDQMRSEQTLPEPSVYLAHTTWEEARLIERHALSPDSRLMQVDGGPGPAQPAPALADHLDSPLRHQQLIRALRGPGRTRRAADVG